MYYYVDGKKRKTRKCLHEKPGAKKTFLTLELLFILVKTYF